MHLGIDFGTCFSQCATFDDHYQRPEVLVNSGEYGIPSVFYFDRVNGELVGQDALDFGQGNPAGNLVREVKMDIFNPRTYELDGKLYSTEEIVDNIYEFALQSALEVAEMKALGKDIESVVATVPVRFGDNERRMIGKAVRKCIKRTDIPIRIIKEPVAAALAYCGKNINNGEYVLVFDLGGGTCDIALVKANSSLDEYYEVVAEDMLRIGGRDWDKELEEYLIARFSQIPIRGDVGLEEKIKRAANSLKENLSRKDSDIARIEWNGAFYNERVTRETFEEITLQLLRQTVNRAWEVYINHGDIRLSEIICVGGGSMMPQVKKELMKTFQDVKCTVNVFEAAHAVVIGACLYANMRHKLRDIASFSYGIKCMDPKTKDIIVRNIIFNGNVLPADGTYQFSQMTNNQRTIDIMIVESGCNENTFLSGTEKVVGRLKIDLPQTARQDNETIEVNLRLDQNGIMQVGVKEKLTGRQVGSTFFVDTF